ncbi:cupin domain-containing protein [Zavarzinia sp. CC-PAN008]|uniref:cupin domain-containing protein n=1 Tax=Zavarzinia sp. CC-PAN008 TaxID=3243332 RepID=UPI003F743F73
MTIETFAMDDRVVACTGAGFARPIPFDEIPDKSVTGSRIMGLMDFTDAESVHADHWEVHPDGDEILCVVDGTLGISIERAGETGETLVQAGQALIVPRACWHRLRVVQPGRLLFLTPSAGTSLRPAT